MDLDLGIVVVALLLPFVPYLMVGREKRRLGIYDRANPRDSNAQLQGWAARAKAAEANSWEALTIWLAVTYVTREAGADVTWGAGIGVAWVAARLGYVAAYIAGNGPLRGQLWTLSAVLVVVRLLTLLA